MNSFVDKIVTVLKFEFCDSAFLGMIFVKTYSDIVKETIEKGSGKSDSKISPSIT